VGTRPQPRLARLGRIQSATLRQRRVPQTYDRLTPARNRSSRKMRRLSQLIHSFHSRLTGVVEIPEHRFRASESSMDTRLSSGTRLHGSGVRVLVARMPLRVGSTLPPFLVAALALGSAQMIRPPSPTAASLSTSHSQMVVQPPRRLLLVRDRLIQAFSTAGPYLTWEQGGFGLRAPKKSPLMHRDQRTGKIKQLAADTLPQFGLASTSTQVVYATRGGSGVNLLSVRRDGTHRILLTRSLAAPLASRGSFVAWAEQSGPWQRVLVRNMRSGREWIAARLRRCDRKGCYRIDSVTLADDGVVFDRGAIGRQPSLIMRRRFHDTRPTIVRLPNDPQPDLAPSSAGAFYYWFQHGWMRWDFRGKRPVTTITGTRSWAVSYERGRLLLLAGSRCRPRLVVQVPSGRRIAIPAPLSTPASPKGFGRLCRSMTDFSWTGRQLLVAWSILPDVSLRSHTDVGLVSVVMRTTIPTSAEKH